MNTDVESDVDDAASHKDHVGAQIPTDQKQRWEEYADENHRTLSHLIRYAVEQEIRDDDDAGNDSPEGSDQLKRRLSGLESGFEQIEEALFDLKNEVEVIRQEVQNNPEIQELASDVFAVLPTGPEEVQMKVYSDGARRQDDGMTTGHPADIAERLDVAEVEVRQAIRYLRRNTAQVHEMMEGDQTHYYKED